MVLTQQLGWDTAERFSSTILRSAKRSERAIFHATNRGSKRGGSHCEECSTPLVNRGRFSPGFIGQSHSQVLRRTLRTCRENIAYNTLPYNFSRMLLLPQLRPLRNPSEANEEAAI
jgi:hypothetical protein